jgi:hypothetical protein
MKYQTEILCAILLLGCSQLSVAQTSAKGKTEAGTTQPSSSAMRDKTVEKTTGDMRAVVKQTARTHIEDSASRATGGSAIVTSRDRDRTLKSPAHARGAIDVVTTDNSSSDARAISKATGPGHTTIREEPLRVPKGSTGPEADRHTIYSDGNEVKSKVVAPRATGEHIHIQPDYGIKEPISADKSR